MVPVLDFHQVYILETLFSGPVFPLRLGFSRKKVAFRFTVVGSGGEKNEIFYLLSGWVLGGPRVS